MIEFAAVFSCLLFSPITASDFSILLFIALLVAFFLLGLIFGLIINPKRKKKEKKLGNEEHKEKLQDIDEPDTLGQDNFMNENTQTQTPNPRDTRNRYYNDFWY